MLISRMVPIFGLILAGCGGGESGPTRGGPTGVEFPVVTGDSAPSVAVPAGSQELIGSHAISLFSIREIQLQKTKGAIRNSDSRLTIADGTSVFVGSGGFDTAGVQTGPIGQVRQIATSGSYSAGAMYRGGISDPGNTVFYTIMQGVYGRPAPTAGITSSGFATYTGDASAIYKGAETVQLNSGSSTLDVNFGAKSANLSMSGFSGNAVPFDTIMVAGMGINGNRFDGGTMTLTRAGGALTALGANTQSTATGAFFGAVNGAGVPAEAGGQVYARGADGALIATFIAK